MAEPEPKEPDEHGGSKSVSRGVSRWVSAALVAWCSFWGFLMIMFPVYAVAMLLILGLRGGGGFGGHGGPPRSEVEVEVPIALLSWLIWLGSGVFAILMSRLQWRRTRQWSARDHWGLAVAMFVLGIFLYFYGRSFTPF